jgi:hypothetical protein
MRDHDFAMSFRHCNPGNREASTSVTATFAPSRRCGFTLIELLVVITTSIIVAAAVGACLAGGIRVWEAAQRFNRPESDAIVAMALLSTDLGSTFVFSGIPFDAQASRLSFPGIVEDDDEGRLGAISYELSGRMLLRQTVPYPEGIPGVERLVTDVLSITFKYEYRENDTGLVSTGMPWKIDFEILLDDDDGPITISRTFRIPIGGGL